MRRFIPHVIPPPRVLAAATAGALAAAALLGSPTAAIAAQPGADAAQMTVYYSFRDLSSDRATRALYQRIVSAARTVCPRYDSQDLDAFAYSQQCQRQAVAHAIHQIGNPRLAAVYQRTLRRHG